MGRSPPSRIRRPIYPGSDLRLLLGAAPPSAQARRLAATASTGPCRIDRQGRALHDPSAARRGCSRSGALWVAGGGCRFTARTASASQSAATDCARVGYGRLVRARSVRFDLTRPQRIAPLPSHALAGCALVAGFAVVRRSQRSRAAHQRRQRALAVAEGACGRTVRRTISRSPATAVPTSVGSGVDRLAGGNLGGRRRGLCCDWESRATYRVLPSPAVAVGGALPRVTRLQCRRVVRGLSTADPAPATAAYVAALLRLPSAIATGSGALVARCTSFPRSTTAEYVFTAPCSAIRLPSRAPGTSLVERLWFGAEFPFFTTPGRLRRPPCDLSVHRDLQGAPLPVAPDLIFPYRCLEPRRPATPSRRARLARHRPIVRSWVTALLTPGEPAFRNGPGSACGSRQIVVPAVLRRDRAKGESDCAPASPWLTRARRRARLPAVCVAGAHTSCSSTSEPPFTTPRAPRSPRTDRVAVALWGLTGAPAVRCARSIPGLPTALIRATLAADGWTPTRRGRLPLGAGCACRCRLSRCVRRYFAAARTLLPLAQGRPPGLLLPALDPATTRNLVR